jgi:ribose-phosphate pyrophosphokinase
MGLPLMHGRPMNDSLKVLSGSAHPALTTAICANLGIAPCSAHLDTFPDGETFVQINENIRGRDVFIVQPTCPPSNQNLMELLIMVDAVRRASARRITAVLPFFGYARQDRKDRPRVPITAKLVANLLVAAGVQRLLTVDLHAGQIQGFFDIPVDHLYAAPVLISAIRERLGDDIVVVSPDVGGIKMTHAFAKAFNAPMAIVAKNRISAEEVQALSIIGDVEGKDVLLVDDLTETAGTLTAAAGLLQKHGAKRIFAAVSHGVLGDKGRERLENSSIVELFATNSTPQAHGAKVTTLDIAPLLGQAIKRIHAEESVTSLFDIRD